MDFANALPEFRARAVKSTARKIREDYAWRGRRNCSITPGCKDAEDYVHDALMPFWRVKQKKRKKGEKRKKRNNARKKAARKNINFNRPAVQVKVHYRVRTALGKDARSIENRRTKGEAQCFQPDKSEEYTVTELYKPSLDNQQKSEKNTELGELVKEVFKNFTNGLKDDHKNVIEVIGQASVRTMVAGIAADPDKVLRILRRLGYLDEGDGRLEKCRQLQNRHPSKLLEDLPEEFVPIYQELFYILTDHPFCKRDYISRTLGIDQAQATRRLRELKHMLTVYLKVQIRDGHLSGYSLNEIIKYS